MYLCCESVVGRVGKEKQIRKEGKKRETERMLGGGGERKWQKEREMYLKRGSHGTLRGHDFCFLCPAIPEVRGHLKHLLECMGCLVG